MIPTAKCTPVAAEFTIRCFGPARHEAGTETLVARLPTPDPGNPVTVDAVLGALEADPTTPVGLLELLPHCAVAIDDTLVTRDHPVSEGDELALLPPVAGG
jgi:molybdopterin converting factor small subunit